MPIICEVHTLMVKPRMISISARLRKPIALKPILDNVRRCSSSYFMLERYRKMCEYLSALGIAEVDFLLPNARHSREIEKCCTKLSDLNTITSCLQSESLSLADVRNIFETVIDEYPSMEGRIGTNSAFMDDSIFERGIEKIQQGRLADISSVEHEALQCALMNSHGTDDDVSRHTSLTLALRAFKRRKSTVLPSEMNLDLRFIHPTSKICERPYSTAGDALNDRCARLLPENFAMQMFLHTNSSYWPFEDVNALLNA